MIDKTQFSCSIIYKDGEVEVKNTNSSHPVSALKNIFNYIQVGLYTGEVTHFIIERIEN